MHLLGRNNGQHRFGFENLIFGAMGYPGILQGGRISKMKPLLYDFEKCWECDVTAAPLL